jgi:nucleotide-binding universal stress UspA family protein
MYAILAPVTETGVPSITAMLRHVAMHIDVSVIEGLHVRAEPSVMLAADETGAATPALIRNLENEEAARSTRVREAFESFMGAFPKAESRWAELRTADLDIGAYARLFDLVALSRPAQASDSPSMGLIEAALFDSGRYLLVAPPTPPESVGDRIVIAWNGGAETARSLACARPFLHNCKEVTMLEVDNGMTPGPEAESAAQYLRATGVNPNVLKVKSGGRSAGAAILEEAQKLNCDLLIKGGYTRSRLRQTIFGGPTIHILQYAEMSVLMSR